MIGRHCDVIVVGGGPAGSTCAAALVRQGADVVVIDRAVFPRDKLCAGWITPLVLERLALEPDEYRREGRTLQNLRGFRTSVIGGRAVETRYDDVVSYGVRRCEFDTFLLRRSGATVLDGVGVTSLERTGRGWVVNGRVSAPVLVGAGGHFCPVARAINQPTRDRLVVAREIELPLGPGAACKVAGEIAELYFSEDLDGYGWCVRKGGHLNVGIGRRTRERFDVHVREFVAFLGRSGRVPACALDQSRWRGHAYLLAGSRRRAAAEDVLLVGDSAGLARAESGEGIEPAVWSGMEAAQQLAAGRLSDVGLKTYERTLATRSPAPGLGARMSARLPAAIGRALLSVPPMAKMALDRWFLRTAA